MAAAKKPSAPQGAFLEDFAGAGLENLTQDDLQIPRLKVIQSISPEVDEESASYVKGLKPGEFLLTIPGVSLGKKVQVVPVFQQTMWYEWRPDRGGLVGRHLPGTVDVDKSDFSEWINTATGNVIEETRDFLVLIVDHEEVGPVILSFTSTMLKAAKSWTSLLAIERTPGGHPAPIFANVWELSLISQSNDKGKWYGITTAPAKVKMITETFYREHVEAARAVGSTINTRFLESSTADSRPAIEHKPAARKSKAGTEEAPY